MLQLGMAAIVPSIVRLADWVVFIQQVKSMTFLVFLDVDGALNRYSVGIIFFEWKGVFFSQTIVFPYLFAKSTSSMDLRLKHRKNDATRALRHCRTNKHQIEFWCRFWWTFRQKTGKPPHFLTGFPTFLIFTSFLSFFSGTQKSRCEFLRKKSHLGTKKHIFSSGCLKWMMNNKPFDMEHGWKSPFLSIHSKNWLLEVPGWP